MEVSKATNPGTGGVDLAAQIHVSQLVAVGPALSSNFCCPLVTQKAVEPLLLLFMDRSGVNRREWRGSSLHDPPEAAAVLPTDTGVSGLFPLGLCLADTEKTVRWCTISTHEASKCASFRENMLRVFETGPFVSCVKKTSHMDCIKAIMNNEADAVTLDGGLVYEAGLKPNNLKPVVAEFHGTKENPQTFYYAVAVVKKGTEFKLDDLKGKKSCHTGLGRSAGWNIPMGKLYKQLPDPQESIQRAAANFFSGSCVPCADQSSFPKLCQLCAGKGTDKCACSNHEPYFGYSGAFKCLTEGGGDVAFVKHSTVLDNLPNPDDRKNYELLCGDNSRKPVDDYHECYLAKVPSHAVVARTVGGKEDVIWELLNHAQEHFGKDKPDNFQLFQSPHGKDLLFKDSADGFLKIPSKMDFELYLGYEYVTALQNLRESKRKYLELLDHVALGVWKPAPDTSKDECKVKWCAIGHHERTKCDRWSGFSVGAIECETAENTEECIAKIMNLGVEIVRTHQKKGTLLWLWLNHQMLISTGTI
ncbi:TF [Cervus elaphus hippelaphus]|uniref:TF n=1 Tax=Cervus elaphus hippelaphus TaxID=46360 RepID=A0A212CIP3_CEREH|nr:TF [Cervus elaphus hippelaphus]